MEGAAWCCRQQEEEEEGSWLACCPLGSGLGLRCSEKPRPAQLPAFIPLPCSFLSPLAGILGSGFLCFFFLSFSTRIIFLPVDCETVLETKSYRSCGIFIATSISQVAFSEPGLCPSELAPLAGTELNPGLIHAGGRDAGMDGNMGGPKARCCLRSPCRV